MLIFEWNSQLMRLFQARLDTCLDSPFFVSLSSHSLHFTVYAASDSNLFKSFEGLSTRMSPKYLQGCPAKARSLGSLAVADR